MAIESKKVRLSAREKARIRIRKKVTGAADQPRLTIFKSSKHTYAQLVVDLDGKTLAAASTLEKEVMEEIAKLKAPEAKEGKEAKAASPKSKSTKSVIAARAVGVVLGRRAKEKKVDRAVFDRNGFLYAGRVQAVADGAREAGLKF